MNNRIRDRSPLSAVGNHPIVRPLPAEATRAAAARSRPKWDIPLIVPFHVNEAWYEATWYSVVPQRRSRPVAFLRLLIGQLVVVYARRAGWFTKRSHNRNAAKHATI
jgi:hypothetical protein